MKQLNHKLHNMGYPDLNGNVRNIVGNRKYTSAEVNRVLTKSGVPRSDRHPFYIPNINTKRNTDRYIQITAVLRQYVEMLIPHTEDQLLIHISSLFGFLDNMFNRSASSFCTTVALLNNWFKVYVLSGKRHMGDIPPGL